MIYICKWNVVENGDADRDDLLNIDIIYIFMKKSLNDDGKKFPQHQKTNNHFKLLNIKPWHMTLDIHVLSRDRHKNVAELNQLMGTQSPLSW